jgi:hypothetical protein
MQEHNFQETAWLVGVDHAKFNLRRDASAPQAFLAGYDSWTGRKKKADVFVRKWLYLRLSAIKRQRIMTSDVTPQFLREIVSPICPVSLIPLTTGNDGKTNWSVDRLENSGAYAAGNLVVLSQRVNEAKGELSFHEVSDIASRGETFNGLAGVEWMRLVSLMYGAWAINSGQGDKYILPQATEFPRHVFHTTSQIVQLYVLRLVTEPNLADTGEVWRAITHKTHGNTLPFEELLHSIKQELTDQFYTFDVWLRPEVFDRFVAWYNGCSPLITEVVESWLANRLPGQDFMSVLVKFWSASSHGYFPAPVSEPPLMFACQALTSRKPV